MTRPVLRARSWAAGSLVPTSPCRAARPFSVYTARSPTGALRASTAWWAAPSGRISTRRRTWSKITDPVDYRGRRCSLFSPFCGFQTSDVPGERVGDVGRNTLRSDAFGTSTWGSSEHPLWAPTTSKFPPGGDRSDEHAGTSGCPIAATNSANFLNQWGTDGVGRIIRGVLRRRCSGGADLRTRSPSSLAQPRNLTPQAEFLVLKGSDMDEPVKDGLIPSQLDLFFSPICTPTLFAGVLVHSD